MKCPNCGNEMIGDPMSANSTIGNVIMLCQSCNKRFVADYFGFSTRPETEIIWQEYL